MDQIVSWHWVLLQTDCCHISCPLLSIKGTCSSSWVLPRIKDESLKVAGFSFLLLHFLCFLKINKKWEPGNSPERSCSLFVLWKNFLLSNFVTLVNRSSSFPIKLAPSKLVTALRTELQSREDHLGNMKMKYFLLPTHLAFLYSFALSKPVQVCPCLQMLRIYIAAAELLYLKINYKLLLLWFYIIEVLCYGDKNLLKYMLFFQIATRNSDLGEFDCNYYINNCRLWWGCFSIPHAHYSVCFSLWSYFPASVENNSQNSDVF